MYISAGLTTQLQKQHIFLIYSNTLKLGLEGWPGGDITLEFQAI